MKSVSAEQLRDRLAALPAVETATYLPARQSPRCRPEIETVLAADVRGLPDSVSRPIYNADWRPFRLGSRCPGHHYVLAEPSP